MNWDACMRAHESTFGSSINIYNVLGQWWVGRCQWVKNGPPADVYLYCVPKKKTLSSSRWRRHILTDFQNSFTYRFFRKFPLILKWLLIIPYHTLNVLHCCHTTLWNCVPEIATVQDEELCHARLKLAHARFVVNHNIRFRLSFVSYINISPGSTPTRTVLDIVGTLIIQIILKIG